MIENNKEIDAFVISCDSRGCNNSEEYETEDDWGEMIKLAKADGWKMFQEMGVWNHTCPSCAEKEGI